MQITQQALAEIASKSLFLKVTLDIGGCCGFKCVFEYVEDILPGFVVLHKMILIESCNKSLFANFELDYINEFGYNDFILRAISDYSMCGCGQSFNKK